MFPAGYTWDAVWTNVQSMMALPVVLGAIIVTLSLWFTPFLVRALMGLTGVNRILKPWEAVGELHDGVTGWWEDRPWHDDEDRPGWRVKYRDLDDDWRN